MIFYFSATGNSKYVAQKTAQSLGEKLISVSDCLKKKEFIFDVNDQEQVGFVFPTYCYGVPTIIIDFIEKLQLNNYSNQYTYLITTCGKECGDLYSQFRDLLSKKSFKLDGASEVVLPDNYILMFNLLPKKEVQQEMFIAADNQITTIVNQIKSNNLPIIKSGPVKYLKTLLTYPFYKYGRKTKHFYTTEACNGCKLCVKKCPIDIIVMDNKKPHWKEDRCIQCLACIHSCPQKAIQHKKRTENRDRYKNPNVIR